MKSMLYKDLISFKKVSVEILKFVTDYQSITKEYLSRYFFNTFFSINYNTFLYLWSIKKANIFGTDVG